MRTENCDETCKEHSGIDKRMKSLEDRADKVDVILDQVRNRLPNWATVVFMLMSGAIGWLLKG